MPGFLSCVRASVPRFVFCFCCCFLLFGFTLPTLVRLYSTLVQEEAETKKKIENEKKKKKSRDMPALPFALLLFLMVSTTVT